MSTPTMNLPINIPWTLVAASADMMDVRPNNLYPPPWRSSLAVYAYQPTPDELDPALCEQQIAFVKVTASITGLQLSGKEASVVDYTSSSEEVDLHDVLEKYLACYGVLLNISVF